MGSMKDVVPVPDDGAVLPAEAVAAITNSDAYPETSGYSKSVDYVDFEIYGKPFTQVVMTLRPEMPRLHEGRPIVVVAGEGGSDNGNGFLATYEGREGIGPWLARRGVTFVAVPRLGRWNFFAEGESGSWTDMPLGERMPVFDRHRLEYWSADDYTSHASQGQASPTGSDTYRLPKEGSALYDHMLAATPDAMVEGYRRGVRWALAALGLPREKALLLYWGFSTGGSVPVGAGAFVRSGRHARVGNVEHRYRLFPQPHPNRTFRLALRELGAPCTRARAARLPLLHRTYR